MFGPDAHQIDIINLIKYQLGLEISINDLNHIRYERKIVEGYSINSFILS